MFRLYLGCESESCVCVCALGTPIVCAGDPSNSLYKRMKYCLRRLLRLECLSLYFPSLSMLVRQQSCLFAGALTSSPHFTLPTNHKRAVRLIYEAAAGITRKVNFQRSQSQSDAALKQQILCQLHLFFFFFFVWQLKSATHGCFPSSRRVWICQQTENALSLLHSDVLAHIKVAKKYQKRFNLWCLALPLDHKTLMCFSSDSLVSDEHVSLSHILHFVFLSLDCINQGFFGFHRAPGPASAQLKILRENWLFNPHRVGIILNTGFYALIYPFAALSTKTLLPLMKESWQANWGCWS